MDFGAMIGRMIRAARLDKTLYQEVETDTSLTREAVTVVVSAGVLSGIGSFLSAIIGIQGPVKPSLA